MQAEEDVIGAVGFAVMTVRPGDTAVAMGIGDLPIVAQSHLLNIMEHAAIIAIADYLESGETTIFVSMEFNSLNSAGIGAELRGNARCVEVVGRNLTFECDVFDGERQIATATLKRTTVERVSFLARTAAQNLIS
jgi:predicted thioesterase